MRTFAIVLCAVGLSMATRALAFDTKPFLKKPYTSVRPDLIKLGLAPVPLKHPPEDSIFCSEGFCDQFPEAIDCSGTGVDYCWYAYLDAKTKQYWVVETVGEIRWQVTRIYKASRTDIRDIRMKL